MTKSFTTPTTSGQSRLYGLEEGATTAASPPTDDHKHDLYAAACHVES